MANWNPLTNAVGSGGAAGHNQYYNTSPSNFGEYGFIFLSEIIDNFTATYTGTGKILANVLKGDISFHAHRALQELSYDTLVSSKSQEIEVCPSLKMPLPHDYVNYTKLTSVDGNGVEHIIYPTRHTSHPFAISQDDDCAYETNADGTLKHQEECTTTGTIACDPTEAQELYSLFHGQPVIDIWNAFLASGNLPIEVDLNNGTTLDFAPGQVTTLTTSGTSYSFATPYAIWQVVTNAIDDYCNCSASNGTNHCGNYLGWNTTIANILTAPLAVIPYLNAGELFLNGWSNLTVSTALGSFDILDSTALNNLSIGTGTTDDCTLTSNTSSNYSGTSGTSIGLSDALDSSIDNSNYFLNEGQRYGIEPEHAQANGSYFIDHMRGNIHFSSALAGKTIILKYISDGHGTDNEMMVPKMAEEAMYKWIAYGCAQARTDVDQGTIARLKQERAAETRKAKIRLSNIKLEEITQIMRGKSKWIKH